MAATGDPFYCHEHKCWQLACSHERHSWEGEAAFVERRDRETRPTHPVCPSCRCTPAPGFNGDDLRVRNVS